MNPEEARKHVVAVVGAGPAGLFAARQIAAAGVHTVLFNRDIKPGGLAEYGIYPSKVKMKEGLRKQFQQILEQPMLRYYGNVAIGQEADFSLNELRAIGFQAILVAVGAQGTKWLGLPGEDLAGVYHAKDIVYHYNRLPPFSEKQFNIGRKVALIGVGNVMLDIAHWLVRVVKVDEVIAIARRGPAEVKFTKKEMETVAANLDLPALEAEIQRVAPVMRSIGQDVDAAKNYILSALPKAEPRVSDTRFLFDFLASPARIIGGERGAVRGLEVEETTLVASASGEPQATRLGTHRTLSLDTVIFCIGDRVDERFGLPVRRNEFVKHPEPCYPVDGISYEAFDPNLNKPVDRVFVAGWSREASHGLVGVARKDGENGAQAVLKFLEAQPPLAHPDEVLIDLERHLRALNKPVVEKAHLPRLFQAEREETQKRGVDDFKFSTNHEMIALLGLD